MKKIIAMLACLTLVLTMFAGLTVSAANYGTPTFKAEFVGFVDATGAEWTESSAEPKFALVKFSYSGFTGFSAYDDGSSDYTYLESVTGIASIGFQTAIDNTTSHILVGTQNKASNIFFNYGTYNAGQKKFGGMAGTFADYVTATSGDICQYVIKVNDHEATNAVTIPSVEFSVKSIVSGVEVDSVVYKTADVTIDVASAAIPKSAADAPAESAYNVTYAGDKVVWGDKPATTVSSTDASKTVTFTVKPAFGYVITAVTGVAAVIPEGGEMTATLTADTEINVTVAEKADAAITYDYVTYDENYGWIAFGKVPAGTATYGIELDGTKYAGANAANGAFGVGFKGLAAGSYTAKAYAGETLAATAATITVE